MTKTNVLNRARSLPHPSHEVAIDFPEELFITSPSSIVLSSTRAFNNMFAVLDYKFVARVFGYRSDRVVVTNLR